MKYLLLIHQNPTAFQAMPEDEKQELMAQAGAIVEELTETGEWVTGEGLADPVTARSVRVRDGAVTVTDGPYAEAKEQVVGFCIVDCDSMDRAIDIAARWPDSRLWGLEVRPILGDDGADL